MHRVERIIAGIVVALFLLDVALIFVRGCNIDWVGYTQMISVGLGMVAVGIVYRSSGRSEKIGLAAISAGTFIIFTIVGSTFNHLLLPVGDRRIDAALIMIDGHFGYSWPALVSFVASLPSAVGYLLRVVYLSSLTQLIAVIVMLAFSGRSEALRLYLLTGVASALLTIAIWSIFPSSGPSAYFDIPDDIVAKLGMVVGPNYGAELNRLALEGTCAHFAARHAGSHCLSIVPCRHGVHGGMVHRFLPAALPGLSCRQPADDTGNSGPWRSPPDRHFRRFRRLRCGAVCSAAYHLREVGDAEPVTGWRTSLGFLLAGLEPAFRLHPHLHIGSRRVAEHLAMRARFAGRHAVRILRLDPLLPVRPP
jgi:hypothetical protein